MFTSILLLFLVPIYATRNRVPGQNEDTCDVAALDFGSTSCWPFQERHELEHGKLFHRIDRRRGRWNKDHPRWSLLEALHGYDRYQELAGSEVDRFEDLYKHVPRSHKKLLDWTIQYSENFEQTRVLIDRNARICQDIVANGLTFYNISRAELNDFLVEAEKAEPKQKQNKARVHRSRVTDALKHMVRDWASEGHNERSVTFPYILEALQSSMSEAHDTYRVLVPGAGLAGLAHEVSRTFPNVEVTHNEKDAYMNLAYRYVMSLMSTGRTATIHPFVDSWSHLRSRNETFRAIQIPSPSSVDGDSLLIEGDFTTSFPASEHGKYDAVATLFFIDTARNIVEYLETIYNLLKPIGTWINVGPLLYGSAPFVQLSLEEVLTVAEHIGFEFTDRREQEVLYNFNTSALYRNAYLAQYWVAKKPTKDYKAKRWW